MKGTYKAADIYLLAARSTTVTADADSKGGVHMECNELVYGCSYFTRCYRHPDIEKPHPSGATEQSLDGLVRASEARSQKS